MDERQLRYIAGIIDEELRRTKSAKPEHSSLAQQISELREQVDALQYELERRAETEGLARDLSAYLRDRMDEIRILRAFRLTMTCIGLTAAVAVALVLYIELAQGLPHLKLAGDHATVAFIAGSFVFCLGIILVVMRGVFGGLHQAETETPYPEHVKEALTLVKDLRSPT